MPLNDRLNFIFKYSTDYNILPIMWIDSYGKIVYYNNSVISYTGEDNLKDAYIYRIASDIKKDDWDKLWKILKLKEKYNFTHVFYNKKLDKLFTLKVYANKVVIENEDYCYMSIIDITKLVDTNNRLLKEKDKAQESERLKDAFLSNMNHEIRTPMNAIVGFAEILDNYVDNTLKEYTNIIINNVDYLLSLIDNIITISKIDSNQIKIKKYKFDVNVLLNNIYINFSNKIEKLSKNLDLELYSEPKIIETDKYILEDCISKLIDNSIKFSDNGEIIFGYYMDNDNIVFYVKDQGIGIQNKHHEIIFDRFRQISKQSIGSGLGLSIFKSYIDILNGKYCVNSKINVGTEIYFQFKINNIDEEKKIIDKKLKSLSGKRLLVADDLDVNQLLIHDILLPYKVDIIKCMDGKECLDKFFEIKDIDIILMDLNMPFIDGYEATKMIREKDKVIPIIAQTAYSQKENRERAKKIGFTDFIVKPIKEDILIKTLLKYI